MSRTNQKVACLTAFWLRFTAIKCRNERATNGRLHKNGYGWEVLDNL